MSVLILIMITAALLVFLVAIWERIFYIVYDGFYKGGDLDLSGYSMNNECPCIINNYSKVFSPCVFGVNGSILCKYYIQHRGMVFRFTKLHYKIKRKFNELNAKKNEIYIRI